MNDQTADRERLAEHFRHRMNGVWSNELEEQHRRKGLDPMRCNDAICRRAVEDADALLASPQFARIIAEAEARAWDEGHERVCGIPARLCGIHGNPYRAALVAPEE